MKKKDKNHGVYVPYVYIEPIPGKKGMYKTSKSLNIVKTVPDYALQMMNVSSYPGTDIGKPKYTPAGERPFNNSRKFKNKRLKNGRVVRVQIRPLGFKALSKVAVELIKQQGPKAIKNSLGKISNKFLNLIIKYPKSK